ncbi:hypothetical protein EJ08DRAFT_306230 [Tothia fuscella]|uniref:Uncharacterized protein n=1 Tax=Tothia fuscella TaxID=1048955 RepID=A0A9P4NP23_9PEZI|nr:hypothetical protein EJ08DRAFT_306230 [Tothia fuscella]
MNISNVLLNFLLPEMSSVASYDESVFLDLWSKIYSNHQLLCYYPSSAIEWPPAEGHAINLQLCHSLKLEPAVISLMQRLPRVRTPPYSTYDFLDETYQIEYEPDGVLRFARDPFALKEEDARENYLLPQDVMLTSGNSLVGICMILDTRANTIRKFNTLTGAPAVFDDEERSKCERPDDPGQYRNYGARTRCS